MAARTVSTPSSQLLQRATMQQQGQTTTSPQKGGEAEGADTVDTSPPSSAVGRARQRPHSGLRYSSRKHIPNLLNDMVLYLVHHKPEDPIDGLLAFLETRGQEAEVHNSKKEASKVAPMEKVSAASGGAATESSGFRRQSRTGDVDSSCADLQTILGALTTSTTAVEGHLLAVMDQAASLALSDAVKSITAIASSQAHELNDLLRTLAIANETARFEGHAYAAPVPYATHLSEVISSGALDLYNLGRVDTASWSDGLFSQAAAAMDAELAWLTHDCARLQQHIAAEAGVSLEASTIGVVPAPSRSAFFPPVTETTAATGSKAGGGGVHTTIVTAANTGGKAGKGRAADDEHTPMSIAAVHHHGSDSDDGNSSNGGGDVLSSGDVADLFGARQEVRRGLGRIVAAALEAGRQRMEGSMGGRFGRSARQSTTLSQSASQGGVASSASTGGISTIASLLGEIAAAQRSIDLHSLPLSFGAASSSSGLEQQSSRTRDRLPNAANAGGGNIGNAEDDDKAAASSAQQQQQQRRRTQEALAALSSHRHRMSDLLELSAELNAAIVARTAALSTAASPNTPNIPDFDDHHDD